MCPVFINYVGIKMEEKKVLEGFFGLLRFSVGESDDFSIALTSDEWIGVFKKAQQQALLGLLFFGVAKHGHLQIPRELVLKWYEVSEQVRRMNIRCNRAAVEVQRLFAEQGIDCCILKGQGNTLNYPSPYIRMCGDVDVWVDGGVRNVLAWVRQRVPEARCDCHHVEFKEVGGVEVEVHFLPVFTNNMIRSRRMERWFYRMAKEQYEHVVTLPEGVGTISVPTHAFNRIFQMAHISHHLFYEGIGLRQIVDYYFVLKQGFSEEERMRDEALLKEFGLYELAGAVMYVLQTVLQMKECEMIVAPDVRRGRFVLQELMLSGNFGWYDERGGQGRSWMSRNMKRLMRDVRMLRYFPSECLWEPVFRVYHFIWRRWHNRGLRLRMQAVG